MFNLQIVLGNLGSDPEMRYTPQGKAVTTFSVASNRSYTKADGQKIKETEWFNCQAWGTDAENCNKYLKKGSLVLVTGRTKTEGWTGTDGQKHSKRIVVVDQVVFVNTRNGEVEQTSLTSPEPAQPENEIPF